MSFLKLVGGTDVKPASLVSLAHVKSHPLELPNDDMLARKRIAINRILGLEIEPGRSLQSLIDEIGRTVTHPETIRTVHDTVRCLDIDCICLDVGIWVTSADEEQELTVGAYATVVKPKKLIKAYPEMAEFADILTKLPLVR